MAPSDSPSPADFATTPYAQPASDPAQPASDAEVTAATGVEVQEIEGGVGATDRRADDDAADPEPGGAAPAGTSDPEQREDVEMIDVPEPSDDEKQEWVVETHGEPPAESAHLYNVIR